MDIEVIIITITITITITMSTAITTGKLLLVICHRRCGAVAGGGGGGSNDAQPPEDHETKLDLPENVFQAVLNLTTMYMGAKLCAECVSLPLLLDLPVLFSCTPRHLARVLPSWSRDRTGAAAIMCQWGLHCRGSGGGGDTISSVAVKSLSESVGLDALFRAKNALNYVAGCPDGAYKLHMNVLVDRIVFGLLCDAANTVFANGNQSDMWKTRHGMVMPLNVAGQAPFSGDVSQNGDGFACFRYANDAAPSAADDHNYSLQKPHAQWSSHDL
jgi:hypothetical protein